MKHLTHLYLVIISVAIVLSSPSWAGSLSSGSMNGGVGIYYTNDGLLDRPVARVEVELKDDSKFKISADTEEGDIIISGSWRLAAGETKAVILTVEGTFKDQAAGSGLLLLDEPLDNGGTPKHLMLQYKSASQQSFHSLSYDLP